MSDTPMTNGEGTDRAVKRVSFSGEEILEELEAFVENMSECWCGRDACNMQGFGYAQRLILRRIENLRKETGAQT